MPLFARRPAFLQVGLPRPDGSGWPDPEAAGRPSFDASTFHELGVRHAYDPEAHAVADRLVEDLLPRIPTGVSEQDEPYLRKVFTTAARIGAGLAIVERSLPDAEAGTVDRRVAAALWAARRKLPAMQPGWSRTGAYFLLAGYHVARHGPAAVEGLVEDLDRPDPA